MKSEARGGDRATGRVGDAATGRRGDRPANKSRPTSEKTLTLNPADKVVIAYLVIIATLILIFSYRIERWGLFFGSQALLITAVVLLVKWNSRPDPSRRHPVSPSPTLPVAPSPGRRAVRFLRGWYPVLLIAISYKELTYLIPGIHPRDFDSALAAIDHRMFGVHPTVWLERFTWPPLTEVLQLTYSTYYFLPIILGAVLWRKRWLDRYYFWVFVIVLGMYLSYLGYIAMPAIGPRFLPSIVEAQSTPLAGVLFFQPVRQMLDSAEGITRDCFPSGHTELTLLALWYARRFHRRTFWSLLPFGSGIIISTVYLRYHYVIDVVAGALLAVAIVSIAKPLYRVLGGNEAQESQ